MHNLSRDKSALDFFDFFQIPSSFTEKPQCDGWAMVVAISISLVVFLGVSWRSTNKRRNIVTNHVGNEPWNTTNNLDPSFSGGLFLFKAIVRYLLLGYLEVGNGPLVLCAEESSS